MRILHVCTSIDPTTGGPANVLARLAPVQARAKGHGVHIVTADGATPALDQVAQSLEQSGVQFKPSGPPRGPLAKGPQVAAEIDALLTNRAVDVVHIHGLWQHAPHHAAKAARRDRVPYVFRPCGMLDPWCLAQGRFKKKIYMALVSRRDLNGAGALHFTTQTEQDLVAPLGLKPPGFIIPNGIDWAEFEKLPEPGRFRAQHGIGDEPLIVFLSRLHHKKGLDLLLPAFAAMEHPDARLVLVGPGEEGYVGSLKQQAAQLGIADRVVFTGMLAGAARIEALADADLFCLPSYQENFGVSVIEALAAATPVLISDQVNIHHAVTQADVGKVVPCDVRSLTKAMMTMLADKATLAHTGRQGRDWVSKTFRWESIADQVDAMYQAVMHSK